MIVKTKIAPMEIETLLLKHPAVKDAAVIGVPDRLAGELPRAFIVKKPSTHVTEVDIINFLQGIIQYSARHYKTCGNLY